MVKFRKLAYLALKTILNSSRSEIKFAEKCKTCSKQRNFERIILIQNKNIEKVKIRVKRKTFSNMK